ncbi:dihydrofolate reductase [Fodinicurvata sp. EGI_FJ10296]|uniref:dihydrofolate reductase n=1 Tax=Fodinicurvata sp. EGI_FJ10296 TaxID=3231908 RepID=UPI003456877A
MASEKSENSDKPADPAPPPAEAAHPDVPAIIAFIVAVARNGVIGCDNALPWHLPGDFRFFKAMTLGKPVIMGRRTFESIGRPLPRRPNIVVSSTLSSVGEGVGAAGNLEFAASPEEAIERARHYLRPDRREIMVIGGAGLFDRLMAEAHRLYLTDVDAEPAGDTYFAGADHAGRGPGWRESWSLSPDPDPADSFAYRFRVFDRDD